MKDSQNWMQELPEEPEELEFPADSGLSDAQKFIWGFLTTVVLSALPMVILWSKNASGLDIAEGAFPTLISTAVGILVFFSIWFSSHKNSVLSGLLGAVISFILLSFGLFSTLADKLLPFLPAGLGSLLLGVVLGGLLIVLSVKLSKTEMAPRLLMVLGLTLFLLFIYNAVSILSPAITRVTSYKPYEAMQSPETVPAKDAAAAQDIPNIYYFVMDECADFYTMERYYGVPMEENPYYTFFKENGFNISTDSSSYTNRSVYCMSNIFSLDYVCDILTTSQVARLKGFDGEWFEALRDLGYDNYQVSTHTAHYLQLKELTDPGRMESVLSSVTESGSTILDLFIDNTILSLITDFADGKVTFLDEITASLFKVRLERVEEFYADSENYTFAEPIALHSYIFPPHTPFFIDSQGNTVSTRYRCNWTDTSYYKEQWSYMADYTLGIVENVLKNDPDSIIIVQSDHGVRGGVFTTESLDVELEDQCRILNAVYYHGEELDIQGLSGVNTARRLLSELGLDYPAIEDMDYIIWQDQIEREKELEQLRKERDAF